MLIYQHIPYARIFFYVFTIGFHFYLLVRSLIHASYFLAAVLLIPVTAISLALWKYTRKAVIRARYTPTRFELDTFYETLAIRPEEIKINGKKIETVEGKKFLFDPSRGQKLIEKVNQQDKKIREN